MPMRLCLVSKELAPFHGWGVGTATAELALALLGAGHEVHLLVDDLPGLRQRAGLEFPGAHVHILADAGLPHFPCLSTRRPAAVYEAVRALHERHSFDAIAFNDFFADGFFAVRAKRDLGEFADTVLAVHLHSTIFLLRDVNGQPEFDLEIAAITHMEASSIREADLLLSPSRAMLERLSGLEGLADTVCGRGIPRVAVFPYALRPGTMGTPIESGPASNTPEVLFFGRLEQRKGPETLVHAAQKLFERGLDFTVRIIGVDTDAAPGRRSMRAHLTRAIEGRWRARFAFEDNLPRAELAPRIRSAACCCFPAIWDNYPNACLEAMQLGACVVASSAGGMAEMIEHERSGLLVPPEDADALSGALRRVLTDASLRASLSAAVSGRVRELCDPARIARAFTDAVSNVVNGKGDRPRVSISDSPPISALIPCFNLGRTLPEAIRSLRAQETPPAEIIVLDDGSTDGATIEYLSTLPARGVRVVTQPNAGLSAARNRLAALASNELLLFLDADDLVHPAFLREAARAAGAGAPVAAVSSFMACFRETPDRPELLYVPVGEARDILPVQNVVSSAIALVRKGSLLNAGGYDEHLTAFEDWDLWCRLIARGERIVVIPRPLILNRIRSDSMLRSMSLIDQQHLRARLLTRHAALASRPDRPMRILLGESCWAQDRAARAEAAPGASFADARAFELVRENLRYRLADQAHGVLKRLGLAEAVKTAIDRS